MYYLINKVTNHLDQASEDLGAMLSTIEDRNKYLVLGDIKMHVVPRITHVDGKCIYNNKKFWTETDLSEIIAYYNNHEVLDFLGLPVPKVQFLNEASIISSRLSPVSERAEQISVNITVGAEFISLFREECIVTDFSRYETTPMLIAEKLYTTIGLIQTGSFREAKLKLMQFLTDTNPTTGLDKFLNETRIKKYIAMLDAADIIQYATDEEYFYPRPDETLTNTN